MSTVRYEAIESIIICQGEKGIDAMMAKSDPSPIEIQYARFILGKLKGKTARYIDPKWRTEFQTYEMYG